MTPFVKVPHDAMDPIRADSVADIMAHYGMDEDAACELLQDYHDRVTYFSNDTYMVEVEPYSPGCLHLCIRRHDGARTPDWRDFQHIKNTLAGPEREAVELYPAESRKVDAANKWHLWVQPEGTRINVGWTKRDVKEGTP